MRVLHLCLAATAALTLSGCLESIIPLHSATDGGELQDAAPAASDPAAIVGVADAGSSSGTGGNGGLTGFAAVQSGLEAKGCTSGACHGGLQAPIIKPAPASDADRMANYTQLQSGCVEGSCLNTTRPDASLLLQKPLADSGVTHVGGKLFADANDPVYVNWLAWIAAGAPY